MKVFKSIGKAFVVAFSIYSKIPMPRFTWESDDMKYHLCFFPWVGAVIGALEWLWHYFCMQRQIGNLAYVCIAIVIPLLITGGFHLDGFMDTCDALHSYQDREKKLEILKDPHIGAFAVICLVSCLLLAGGALSMLFDREALGELLWDGERCFAVLALGFFLTRCLSGISVVTMQGAKKKGMLQTFSDTAVKKTVLMILILQGLLVCLGMILLQPVCGLMVIASAGICYLYYWKMSAKQFGGITGDLAGYFVTVSELVMTLSVAVISMLF